MRITQRQLHTITRKELTRTAVRSAALEEASGSYRGNLLNENRCIVREIK